MERVEEHLSYEKDKSEGEIQTHLEMCHLCKQIDHDNFQIVKKSLSDHEAKSFVIQDEDPP